MKVWLCLFLLALVVMVSGCSEPSHEDLVSCSSDSDCICGIIIGKEQCYMGNRLYIMPSDVCFRLCFGDDARKMKCVDSVCSWVKIRQNQPDFPVADIVYGAVSEADDVISITVKNTGPVSFTPTLEFEVSWDNISIHNASLKYDAIDVGRSQARQAAIPQRNSTGWWRYNSILLHSDGSVINQSSVSYYKPPPPEYDAFMYFKMKPRYLYLNDVSVGVRNVGNLSFVPLVHMTVYKKDMDAIYSDSMVYKKLDTGKNETKVFKLPPLENITYYLDFVLSVVNTTLVLEHINFKVLIGTW